jgi:tetratricopeptide (TPR) repeat protein
VSGRSIARFVAGLVMVAAWTSIAWAQQPATLEAARALYDAGRLDDARSMLEDLARARAGDAGVHLLLGVVERTAGRLPEAVASLERAHSLEPESAQAAVELATTLAWQGRFDRAVRHYEQVLARDPLHQGARVGLGFALAWRGDLEKAYALFRELVAANPRSVDAWSGLGFVDRASLRRDDAMADYRQALEIDPQNKDATAALEELHWDRRTELRVLGGGSTVPDGAAEPEARIDFTHAVNPRVSVGGGYQRYAFGAVLPIAGVTPTGETRAEDSLEANVTLRPSRRFTLGNSIYTFFSDGQWRGIVWEEGVFTLSPRIALIGGLRPAFSSVDPHWLLAGSAGTTVTVATGNTITVKALVGGDTTYEPRLTWLADYAAAWSRRFQMQLSVANSSSDEAFAFTSVAASVRWLMTPSVGLSVLANHRTQTFERSEILFGVVVRR